jgi:hypothetical protein
MLKSISVSFTFVTALSCAEAASAATFAYSGEIDSVESTIGLFQKGNTFRFNLTIDTAQPGTPVGAQKTYAAQPTTVHFSNGYVLDFAPTITVDPQADFVSLTGAAHGNAIGDVAPFFAQSYDYGALSSAALPNLASFYAANPFAPFQIMFSSQTSGLQAEVGAHATSVAETPLPAALPLFIAALCGLGLLRRRSTGSGAA